MSLLKNYLFGFVMVLFGCNFVEFFVIVAYYDYKIRLVSLKKKTA